MSFSSSYLYTHASEEHEPPMFSVPTTNGSDSRFASSSQHLVYPAPVPRQRHAQGEYTSKTSPFNAMPRPGVYSRNYCHFMRLTVELRLYIYELALDTAIPRRVLLDRPIAWRENHLTQSEKIQHASAVLDVITKGSEAKNDLRYDFKLRQHSPSETRAMAQALWPPLLRVCRESRIEGSRIFYRQASFVAPADPYTIPEWESRLSLFALRCLSKNKNLTMEHLCGEKEQWRCLRAYLYNASRQSYQIAFPKLVIELWGEEEIAQRHKLKSVPWRFVQRDTLLNKYKVVTIDMNDMLLAEDSTLHICFHNEFLEEFSRIDNVLDRSKRRKQLLHLRDGVVKFFRNFTYLEESDDWYRLHFWLQDWLADPTGSIPRPLFGQRTPGGLFWGYHLFEVDILGFLQDVRRNQVPLEKGHGDNGRDR